MLSLETASELRHFRYEFTSKQFYNYTYKLKLMSRYATYSPYAKIE